MLIRVQCASCGHAGLMSTKPPLPKRMTCSKCGSRMLAGPERPPPAPATEEAVAEA